MKFLVITERHGSHEIVARDLKQASRMAVSEYTDVKEVRYC